ncbi:MAG: thioredoxin [Firmicutes bacterium]|nr:thioredoxin [Bacillota bacterium]
MEVLHITKDNFDEIVLKGDKPVLLDFYADWCGPCKAFAPVLAEVAAERSDVVFGKVNIDLDVDLAKTFKVRSVPTLVLMDKEDTLGYSLGSKGKVQLNGFLDKSLKERGKSADKEEKKGLLGRLFGK